MELNNDQQIIERYFENDLNQEELTAFEKRLSEDAAFARAFEEEKELMEGIEAFGNDQLRIQLDMIHAEETGMVDTSKEVEPPKIFDPFEVPKEDGKVVNMVRRRWWLAAAVIGIGVVARWLFSTRKPNPQQLYAMFAVHNFDLTEMGDNEELLTQAEALLKNGKYAEALPLLDAYLETNPDQPKVRLNRGAALLENGQYTDALSVFQDIASDTPILANDAHWYTALTFLKQGDVENCKKALNQISGTSTKYKDVNKLLEYLK
ncbi:MAG: tetratricopeptide repeat protein [Bacteroidota bacterium]